MSIKQINYKLIKDCALRLRYLKDFYYITNIFIVSKENAYNLANIIEWISGVNRTIKENRICFVNYKNVINIWYDNGLKTIGRWSRSNLMIIDKGVILEDIIEILAPLNNLQPYLGVYYYDTKDYNYLVRRLNDDPDNKEFFGVAVL